MILWALVIVSLIGTVLNVQRRRSGFIVWIVSNAGLAITNADKGDWAQASLFAVYLLLAVWGWMAWGEGKDKPQRTYLCESCTNRYDGTGGNGYQPCGCREA